MRASWLRLRASRAGPGAAPPRARPPPPNPPSIPSLCAVCHALRTRRARAPLRVAEPTGLVPVCNSGPRVRHDLVRWACCACCGQCAVMRLRLAAWAGALGAPAVAWRRHTLPWLAATGRARWLCRARASMPNCLAALPLVPACGQVAGGAEGYALCSRECARPPFLRGTPAQPCLARSMRPCAPAAAPWAARLRGCALWTACGRSASLVLSAHCVPCPHAPLCLPLLVCRRACSSASAQCSPRCSCGPMVGAASGAGSLGFPLHSEECCVPPPWHSMVGAARPVVLPAPQRVLRWRPAWILIFLFPGCRAKDDAEGAGLGHVPPLGAPASHSLTISASLPHLPALQPATISCPVVCSCSTALQEHLLTVFVLAGPPTRRRSTWRAPPLTSLATCPSPRCSSPSFVSGCPKLSLLIACHGVPRTSACLWRCPSRSLLAVGAGMRLAPGAGMAACQAPPRYRRCGTTPALHLRPFAPQT